MNILVLKKVVLSEIVFNEDLEHYQKMIVALIETERIMKEIDNVYLSP